MLDGIIAHTTQTVMHGTYNTTWIYILRNIYRTDNTEELGNYNTEELGNYNT